MAKIRMSQSIKKGLVLLGFLGWSATLQAKALKVDMQVSTSSIQMGDYIALEVRTNTEMISGNMKFANRVFRWYLEPKSKKNDYTYLAYIAAPINTPKGVSLNILVAMTFPKGRRFEKSVEIKYGEGQEAGKVLAPKRVPKIQLKGEAARVNKNTALLAEESAGIRELFKTETRAPRLALPFKQPVQGKISSGFGIVRNYQDTENRVHKGVDIAAKEGDWIVAPEKGTVIMSQFLECHGESIMIDHGYGIITIYNHLSERRKAVGDSVKKGELIGKVGQTGVSTGAHLHWGLSVQNIRVNPLKWVGI